MCVAVIVQTKKRIPREQLKAMSDANPHGGGIAWYIDPTADKGIVLYRKGMSWEEIDYIQDRLPRPFFLHFRIATKGEKIPELTHPFPLGMQAFTEDLAGKADMGVLMHNGTWPDYHKFIPEGINSNTVSDTQVAAYHAAFREKILDDVKWSNAIMDPDGIRYRGRWEKFEGNLFSNTYWQRELNKTEWEYAGFYGNSRTITPYNSRKRGMPAATSHQGQYQTQFNKAGQGVANGGKGKGLNTLQSNGKTIAQNRAEKRKLLRLKADKQKESAYELVRKDYLNSCATPEPDIEYTKRRNSELIANARDAFQKRSAELDKEVNSRMTMSEGAWDGEPLFTKDELKPSSQRITQEMEAQTDVRCHLCDEIIEVIPCPCCMTSEELEKYIDSLNDDGEIVDVKLEDIDDFIAEAPTEPGNANEPNANEASNDNRVLTSIPATKDDVPVTYNSDGVQIRSFNSQGEQMSMPFCDVSDVEDMNAYGLGAVFDADGGPNTWKELQDAIARDGIKVRGE